MSFGCQSMVEPVKRVLLKHPRDAFLSVKNLSAQWKDLNYLACPDYAKAVEEYDSFAGLLARVIPRLEFLPARSETGPDSIYTHDPVIVTARGAILCNMGKAQRRREPAAAGEYLQQNAVPILGKINGKGKLEGGDVVWIDEHSLAVGLGYRTNNEGIRQLRDLARDFVKELIVVPLVHWNGPGDVLHLMSVLSPIDDDLAVVYSRLLPAFFREWLIARGIRLVEVSDQEFKTMGCNIFTVAPRKCVMLVGNPETKRRLEKAGAEVWEFNGEEICVKGAGGPTCLTRPIWRT